MDPTVPDTSQPEQSGPPHGGRIVARVAALSAALRDRGVEAALADDLDEIHQRLRAMDRERREIVEQVCAAQIQALTRCLEGVQASAELAESTRRDAHLLRRSIGHVVAANMCRAVPIRERVELRYSNVDLVELVRQLTAPFERVADERQVRFVRDVPDRLDACVDVGKVQRVLLNLVFNAFKYTPVGGTVRVELRHVLASQEAVIRVVDTGPGIARNRIEAVLTRREPLDQDALAGEGLELDLGLQRDYIALQGGSLRVAALGRDHGADLQVRLPARAPAGTPTSDHSASGAALAESAARRVIESLRLASRPPRAEPPPGEQPLVLLVEDSEGMQLILARALEGECRTVAAFDGKTAIEQAVALTPDLIVVDLELPSMGAPAVVREIRSHGPLADVPVMAISAERDPNASTELLRTEVQDVLRKPFSIAELQARVHNLVTSKRAHDMLGTLVGRHERDLCALAEQVAQHQRRLEEALEDLRVARESAESASLVKSNFLRMMSHELKTPVAAMALQLQILMRTPISAVLPPEVSQGFERLQRSISRLVHLVDTILEWARVESGRSQVASDAIELGEVTSSAVRDVEPQAIAKDLSIDTALSSEPELLIGDARLIRLITVNLLERAVKLTEDGVIRVEVGSKDGWALVRVADHAPAMSRVDERQLFDPLSTTGEVWRHGGTGSGLELHVVRDLARAIGGDLRLIMPNDDGNTIELMIPRGGRRHEMPVPVTATA